MVAEWILRKSLEVSSGPNLKGEVVFSYHVTFLCVYLILSSVSSPAAFFSLYSVHHPVKKQQLLICLHTLTFRRYLLHQREYIHKYVSACTFVNGEHLLTQTHTHTHPYLTGGAQGKFWVCLNILQTYKHSCHWALMRSVLAQTGGKNWVM